MGPNCETEDGGRGRRSVIVNISRKEKAKWRDGATTNGPTKRRRDGETERRTYILSESLRGNRKKTRKEQERGSMKQAGSQAGWQAGRQATNQHEAGREAGR